MEIVQATFFTDPWLMLLVGSLFALVAGAEAQPIMKRKTFWYGFIAAMVMTAAAIFFYVVNPEWMMLYIIRHKEAPVWLGWSLFLLYPFPYTASYVLGLELRKLRAGGDRLWFAITLVAVVVVHALIVPYWTSWTTTEAYQGGFRGGFFSSPLWLYLGVSALASVAAAGGLLWLSVGRREDR